MEWGFVGQGGRHGARRLGASWAAGCAGRGGAERVGLREAGRVCRGCGGAFGGQRGASQGRFCRRAFRGWVGCAARDGAGKVVLVALRGQGWLGFVSQSGFSGVCRTGWGFAGPAWQGGLRGSAFAGRGGLR